MKKKVTSLLLGAAFALALAVPIFAAGKSSTSAKAAQPASQTKDFLITGIRVGTGVFVNGGYNPRKKTISYYSHSDPEYFEDALALAMILNTRDSNRRYIALGRGSFALDMALSDVVADGVFDTLTLGGKCTISFKKTEDGKFTSMERNDNGVPYFYCKVLNYDMDGNIKEFLDASIPTQVYYENGKVSEINPGYEANKLTYDGDRLTSSLNYTYLYNDKGQLNYIGKTSITAHDPDMVSNIQYNADGSVKQFDFRGTVYEFMYR